MSMIAMRRTDLAELYTLLKMYDSCYGGVQKELLESIKESYKAPPGGDKEGIPVITNPRGAGRKSGVTTEQISRARQLHEQGRSMRKIAKELGCSVGRVHKLINEHVKNEVKNRPYLSWGGCIKRWGRQFIKAGASVAGPDGAAIYEKYHGKRKIMKEMGVMNRQCS